MRLVQVITSGAPGRVEIHEAWEETPTVRLVVSNERPASRRGGIWPIWNELQRARSMGANFGEYKQALTLLDQFIEKFSLPALGEPGLRPLVATAMYDRAVTYDRLAENRHAIDAYREVIDQYGEHSLDDRDIRQLIIDAFFRADTLLAAAEKDAIQDKERHRELFEERLQRSEEFVVLFSQLSLTDVALREHIAHALLNRAHSWHRDGFFQNALSAYGLVVAFYDGIVWIQGPEADPEYERGNPAFDEHVAYAILNKGIVLYKLERLEEAVAAFSDLIERFSGTNGSGLNTLLSIALFNMAGAFARLRSGEKAIKAYNHLISRFGASADPAVLTYVAGALINKADTLHSMDRSTEAVATLDEVTDRFTAAAEERLRHLAADALVRKGAVLQSIGFRDDAVLTWEEVISLFGSAESQVLNEQVVRAKRHISSEASNVAHYNGEGATVDLLSLAFELKNIRGDARRQLTISFVTIVNDAIKETRSYEAFLIYIKTNSGMLKEWKDVEDVPSGEPQLGKSASDILELYLESRKVPRGLRPYLTDRFNALIEEAQAEIFVPPLSAVGQSLSEDELNAFRAHAEAHPWQPRCGISPSAFIRKEFAAWLGHGLKREHVVHAQPKLAEAYGGEIRRHPENRIKELIERPRNLPPGTPAKRSGARKLAAELSPEELAIRRKKVREQTSLSRARAKSAKNL